MDVRKNFGNNSKDMKMLNRRLVLRLVRRGPVARSEMAAETNLTRAAMSLIVGELLNEGVLVETGKRVRSAGRKPVLLQLRPEYAHSVGLSLSRTGVSIATVDLAGQPIESFSVNIEGAPLAAAIGLMKQGIQRAIAVGRNRGRLLGLGISTPGPVDYQTGTILNPVNFNLWHGVRFASEFQAQFGDNIFVENRATALAIAERAYGEGREFDSFLLLSIRSGIGAGIFRNHELLRGWHGLGNEVGHTSIDFKGPRCSCGLSGCVETYASIPAILSRARQQGVEIATWSEFVDQVGAGDPICSALAAEQAQAVGTAIVNIINVMELDGVILAGEIVQGGEMLCEAVAEFVNQYALNRRLRRIPVHLSRITHDADTCAAAAIVAERFFQGEL